MSKIIKNIYIYYKMVKFNSEEILMCLIFVVLGYCIATMFSRCRCNNGFRVGCNVANGKKNY